MKFGRLEAILLYISERMLATGVLRRPTQLLVALAVFLFNSNSEGGVQVGPLGTAATNRPIVPAPSDYDDGEIGGLMTGRGNRSNRRKPAPMPLCPSLTPHALPGCEPGPPRWEASD
jgi:hypothetical protein